LGQDPLRPVGEKSVEVPCTTLDSIAESLDERRIDILKLHVGGDEPIVVRGGWEAISSSHPMMIMIFGRAAWEGSADLLQLLAEDYDLFEVVRLARP
jgi:hypothetical protein